MLVSLTVGKVDAGVAVLLTEDKRLIEFPSVLLPPDISSGSIVDVTVSRNLTSESLAASKFAALQDTIYRTFGAHSPSAPVLRCRNATQTSVVLEWDAIDFATSELRSLSLYRNGQKAGNIPRPRDMMSTKISGLAVDTEYTFHLVLRTSAGTFSSEKLTVRTHKMTQLSGITVSPGIMPASLLTSLKETIDRMGARMIEGVRIDTTHFVTTEGRGRDWEKAVEMNVPVVVPDWVKGCEREGRIVGVRGYYLNADPRLRQMGTPTQGQPPPPPPQQQQGSQEQLPVRPRTPIQSPRTEVTPPTPDQPHPPVQMHAPTSAPIQEAEPPSTSSSVPQQSRPEHEADTSTLGGETLAEKRASLEDDDDDENDELSTNGNGDTGKDEDEDYARQRELAEGALSKARGRADEGAAQGAPAQAQGQEEAGDFDEVAL
ncbi:hypothetical protein NA57DRAFT_66359 [Rhizodiscina lignyota]|uniref:Chitin biosynthesis protein CHS5 n=1 Tax=Rhizodiscina lignyota TaxID=1504668 RepID=A0A9P4IA18_9PEZI|nr:hypothetical protein NA57DRAFT_66359 [Rhizodiscina lignyota]